MSIKARLEEAEQLWADNHREGAWLPALVAAAATARRRYPKPMGDRDAFGKFISDIAGTIMTGKIDSPGPLYFKFYTTDRSEHRTLEDILYKEVRCNLVHEGELKEVGFSQSIIRDGHYEADLSVPSRGQALIPDFWVLNLIAAIRAAPENKDL